MGVGAKRMLSSQKKYELPKYLPDVEKEFGVRMPKDYLPPQYRDPYQKYDDQQNRVNRGEKIHPFHDYIDMWSPDHFHTMTDRQVLTQFLAFFGSLAAFGGAIYFLDIWPDRPSMPRQYPYEGLYRELGGKEDSKELYQANPDKEYE